MTMAIEKYNYIVWGICVIAVAVSVINIYAGIGILLIIGLPLALFYRRLIAKHKERLQNEGVKGLIRCECFDCDDGLFEKNTGYTVFVYDDALRFKEDSSIKERRINKSEVSELGVYSLDDVRGMDIQKAGKLRKTIDATDRQNRKSIQNSKRNDAKYLIMKKGSNIYSFFITAQNQRLDKVFFESEEASISGFMR